MKKWIKILIIVFLIMPSIFIFNGCSCNDGSNTNENSNVKYTVTFYTGSGTTYNIPNQEIKAGGYVTQPKKPSTFYETGSDGIVYICSFVGWYEDSSCTDLWLFESDQVNRDLTLFAKWDKKPQ